MIYKQPNPSLPILRNIENFSPGAFYLTAPAPTIRHKRVSQKSCTEVWDLYLSSRLFNL